MKITTRTSSGASVSVDVPRSGVDEEQNTFLQELREKSAITAIAHELPADLRQAVATEQGVQFRDLLTLLDAVDHSEVTTYHLIAGAKQKGVVLDDPDLIAFVAGF